MVDVLAEHDGLVVAVRLGEKLRHLLRDQLGPLLQDHGPVEVALVVDAVLDLLAELVELALLGPPAGEVLVEVDADDLVGARKPSSMPCFSEYV